MSDPAADGATDEDTIVVYADYVCPFCYLGRASLETYRESREDPPAVEWRPFDLRAGKRGPDGELDDSVDDGKDEAYFERATENVRRLQAEYGVEMAHHDSRDVDAWNAHQAALWAERNAPAGTVQAFHGGLFDALWREERDIGDPDVVVDVAADAGLDPAAVREAMADEDLEADLRERFTAAARAGITGVPTFVYGEHAARGAVPPEHLARLVEG